MPIDSKLNKLFNKFPLILLCTIKIDDSLLVAVSYHSKDATGRPGWAPGFLTPLESVWNDLSLLGKASHRLRV
jgi:hypothetical protein